MKTYGFTLQLEGIDRDGFPDFCEAVYAAANDCTASFRGGVAYAVFDRGAASLRQAIASAIDAVHRAAPSVTVVGVILDDGQPIDALIAAAP